MDAWTPPVIVDLSEPSERIAADGDWKLMREDSAIAALALVRPDAVSLTIDFTAGKTRHRTLESGMGAQALSKAVGVRQFVKEAGLYPTIIDATGGLGQDAWALASIGCEMIIFERHPVIHALLADGLARAEQDPQCRPIAERMTLIHGDALLDLQGSCTSEAHAVYLDPMYPSRRKKAHSKKGMQFLHALLGPPADDDPALLLKVLASGVSRVAVKRPKGAPLLAGSEQFTGQRTVIESPNTRYDIYHCKGNPPAKHQN